MNPINRLAAISRLAMSLTAAMAVVVPTAMAQGPSQNEAGAWSAYRPGMVWAPTLSGDRHDRGPARSPVYVSQSGWATYAPSSAWRDYRGVTGNMPPQVAGPAPRYVSRHGWATYAPSSAWTGYTGGTAWQSNEPRRARPPIMSMARVPGPSPYSDGRPHPYYEYGTGRPVPQAKPWLPGAP